jgi:hypothetical protein
MVLQGFDQQEGIGPLHFDCSSACLVGSHICSLLWLWQWSLPFVRQSGGRFCLRNKSWFGLCCRRQVTVVIKESGSWHLVLDELMAKSI